MADVQLPLSRRPRALRPLLLAVIGLLVACVRPASADAVKPDKPVRVATTKADKSRLVGRVASYDDAGFELLDDKNAAQTVKWSDLPAKSAMEVYAALLPKGTAQDWVTAGRVMYNLTDGKDVADRAFARALRLDPKVKDAIEAAKKATPANPKAAASSASGNSKSGQEMLGEPGKVATRDEVMKHLWGPLSEDEQAASIKTLKSVAEKTRKGKDGSLKLFETKYFLLYSDLKQDEASKWAGLLDRMYARLSDLFGVAKDTNVWRGKCLIFVYAKADDYYSHEQSLYQVDAKKTAGMCTSYSDGYVHVAFYRQPQELDFAHVLVHESVHGFIHRYRSHVNIPSWANEGLAEVIASELVPQKAQQVDRHARAIDSIRSKGLGSDFFTVAHIVDWQYAVAENLCSYMIAQNKKGYVAFINGVKDGQSVDESLEKNYGANEERISAAYIAMMNPKGKKK
jgi:hypothetical protein